MPHVAARTASRDRDTGRYQSHRPEQTLLYQIVDEYYPAFAALMGVVCGRGRNPTLRLWPTIFSGKIDVFPGDRRSRLISSMTSVAPA